MANQQSVRKKTQQIFKYPVYQSESRMKNIFVQSIFIKSLHRLSIQMRTGYG